MVCSVFCCSFGLPIPSLSVLARVIESVKECLIDAGFQLFHEVAMHTPGINIEGKLCRACIIFDIPLRRILHWFAF